MNFLKKLRNYLCYCGIEKEEYKAIKKDAYVSNFEVWRILHFFMTVAFASLYINSLVINLLMTNRLFYLIGLLYSVIATCLSFFVLKKDSIIAQFLIYLSISLLFLFAALIAQNNPELPAITFIVFLIITPMFMIDKPYFMAIEMGAASVIFLIWMHAVKSYDVFRIDLTNTIIFLIIGIVIHVIANSLRIKEFVLTRKINLQKDYDDLTGLKNKSALTKEINAFLADRSKRRGLMFLMDFDRFKSINDRYGHDVGDDVISQFGEFLKTSFTGGEIVGRFGGDEFIVFIKDTDDLDLAADTALKIANGSAEYVSLPDKKRKFSVSLGIAVYSGIEKNYSEIFKKADIALYRTKADKTAKFNIYDDSMVIY